MKIQLAIIFFIAFNIASTSAWCNDDCSSCIGSICHSCFPDSYWNPNIQDCVSYCIGTIDYLSDAYGGAGVCYDTYSSYSTLSDSSRIAAVIVIPVSVVIICLVCGVCLSRSKRKSMRAHQLERQRQVAHPGSGDVVVVGIPVQQELPSMRPNRRLSSIQPEIQQVAVPMEVGHQDQVIPINHGYPVQGQDAELATQQNGNNIEIGYPIQGQDAQVAPQQQASIRP